MMTDRDRNAGTPASHAAAEHPRHPAHDGRAWFLVWIAPLAGARAGLRALLPVLFALLLLAGWTSGAGAATLTLTPSFVCEGQTADVVVSGASAGQQHVFAFGASGGTASPGTNFKLLNSDGTEFSDHATVNATSDQSGNFTLRVQNISANGSADYTDQGTSYDDFTIVFHPSTHADCAAATDGVTVSPTSLALTELGASSAVEKTYTVVLDTDPGVNVTVTATVPAANTSDARVRAGGGASGATATLTFTAGGDGSGSGAGNGNWAVAQAVTVEARIDGDVVSESFSVTHAATAASGPYSGISVAPVAVTIADAGHGVEVREPTLSVAENDQTENYKLKLKSQPGGTVTITATSGATATATVSPASVSFDDTDWDTPKIMTVTGKGAGSTTISHEVSAGTTAYPTSTTIPGVAVTVTADARPTVTLSPAGAMFVNAPEGEDAEFTVTLSAALGAGVTIPITVTGLTATAGDDYTVPNPSSVTIAAGDTEATFTIATVDDDSFESNELLRVAIDTASLPGTVRAGTDTSSSVVIVDDDGGGVTVSPTSLALTELGSSSTIEKTYTVVLDTDPGATVTITATSGDTTAVEVDTDAGTTGNQNTLTFTHGNSGNWSTAQTVTVRALNDTDSANESFNITHAATATGNTAPYHGISVPSVAVTTTDAGHGVVVSKSSLSVAANDETDTYTVVLKSRPSGNVVISATSGATARATVSPGTLTFGASDWNTPKTFTVTGKGAGPTSISHAVQSSADTTNYPTTTTIPAVSVTVTADSRQVLDLSFGSNRRLESAVATLTVTATGGSGIVVVTGGTALLTLSGDGIASSDYSFNTRSNFILTGGPPPSETVGIDLANDNVDEPNETLVVGLQNLPGGFRAGTTASITIVDRNPTTVTLAGGGTVTEDGANSADVTVTLSRNLVAGETVTVPLAIAGTGIAAGDYTIVRAPGSSLNRGVTLNTSAPHSAAQPAVVFTGHGTNTVQVATLRVTAVQDNTDEGASEALAVGFGSGNRAVRSNLDRISGTGTTGTTTAGTATVTITDDDGTAVPVLSVALPSVEGVTRNTAGQQVFAEAGAGTDDPEVSFHVTLAPAPSADFAACIRVTETGGDRVAAGAEGVKAVTVPDTGSLVHTIQWTDTAADDRDSVVTVEAVAPETAGCSAANGTYTVSSTDASDSALVRDDDSTTVQLLSGDSSMTEGDASDTAALEIWLDRQLYAGEVVVVPFTLATTTGARLPGNATPDFSVSASGTGVTIANANTATPSVTFTGHGTDTVRTARVTLTPVANRDDGDTAHEAITATLASDSVLGSTSGSGTTVGGGAMRHGTNFARSLTLNDDEAPKATVTFSVSDLRLLENGSATYTVVLDQEPTADVDLQIFRVGDDSSAVTTDPSVLNFSTSGSDIWNSPQTVTVTGADEPGTHRNRTLTLRHTATSLDGSYNAEEYDLPVEVGDAPEVEAWEGWNRATPGASARLSRPHTVASTPGIWPRQDFVPGGPLDYVIRLSNRPEPGGTVTVNVSRSNASVQLGLTRNGPWRSSLTVTFGDGFAQGAGSPNIDACNNSHDWTRGGEAHDATAATSWECWRKIWVRPLFHDGGTACTDLTHTASGGGVRSRTIETIRAHNPHYYRDGNRRCAILTPNTEPAALNAAAVQVPAAQVANLEVAKVDSTSASANWDAVAHATGYEVAWDALDGNGQAIASGIHIGVTGTTQTIEHQAPGAASLTVTVTPEYVDGNGDTQVLGDLAATAALDLSTPQSAQADSLQAGASSCDLVSVKADVGDYILETQYGTAHVARWKKALAGLNREADGMTAAGARQMEAKYSPGRWQPVVEALDCLEKAALPVISVSAGPGMTGGVTEGDPATFTVTATPAPSAPLTVGLTVGQSGDYAASGQTGTRQVTVPTGGSATLSVATADDGADEPDGSVTATVEPGTGYTVGGANTASVSVADDDDPPAAQADSLQAGAASCDLVSVKADVNRYIGETQHGAAHVARWKKALAGLNREVGGMTAAGARQMKADFSPGRWQPVVDGLDCLEKAATPQPETPQPETPAAVPELRLAAGDAVDEGGDAVFTVHADPAPAADLTVAFTVAQDGDWLAALEPASRTLTLAAGATSATVTLATVDDEADEADGSVSVTLDVGTGYTIAAGKAAGAVAVRDNDTPAVSVAAGNAVTEGSPATFTLSATPAPGAPLTVTLAVTQSGDYAAQGQTGAREVTIPTAGSIAIEVATADDGADEADGSIAATVQAGSGYTVADPPDDAASVAVADDDDPVISIAAGSGVTEGNPAAFTVTASPVPHADLTVSLAVTQSGDYAASGQTGTREVTIPTGGSASFEVATVNDTADEPDGSVTATLAAGSGYAVAASPDDAALVAVADDDVAAAGVPTLSVNDVEVKEGPYRRVEFTVTLSEAVEKYVSFYYRVRESSPVSARRGVDFWAPRDKTFAGMRPGETEYRIKAGMVIDDSHDEDPETFEIVLSDANGAAIADAVGVATIVNDDPMPAAWLARFGRTVAEQALDGIAGRIAAPREAGAQGTLAGQALNFDPGSDGAANDNAATGSFSAAGGFGGLGNSGFGTPADGFGPFGFGAGSGHDAHLSDSGAPQSQTMTGLEALLGSSFTATGEQDGSGGSIAFWGRAAQSSFDGREGTFSLDGETTTAMLGTDYARGRWLVGLALMQSSGEGGYADTGIGAEPCPEDMDLCDGAVRTGDGKVEATLTAAVPYAAIKASERLKLWGAAGHGTGEVTLKPDVGGALKSDIFWSMASAGARGDLLPPSGGSGPALALTADGLWARTSSEKTHELASSESDVTRLRLGLEGSYRIALEEGGHVTPKAEVGARHDGGDAETGFGVELGGGLVWSDPTIGLSLDLSGRTLIAHGSDDLEDRGFAASLAFDPDPATKRGPSFSLCQDWGGQATGGLDALFQTDPLADRTGSAEPESRWQAEAAWGFPAFSGRFTGSPHVGLGLATGARDYTLGWRLTPAANDNVADVSFGLKATRRENEGVEPEHTVGFEINARW